MPEEGCTDQQKKKQFWFDLGFPFGFGRSFWISCESGFFRIQRTKFDLLSECNCRQSKERQANKTKVCRREHGENTQNWKERRELNPQSLFCVCVFFFVFYVKLLGESFVCFEAMRKPTHTRVRE